MKKTYIALLAVVVIGAIAGVTFFHFSGEGKVELKVFCAGSLMEPFKTSGQITVEEKFENKYPNVNVQVEGHGSIQCIRHVTEIHQKGDVVAVADHTLIPLMMYNTKIPDSDENYADWHTKFARNELGIAYTPQSDYADKINQSNWYDILSREKVQVGISDPRLDACGYRVLMILQLTEHYYDNESIAEDLLFDEFMNPINITQKNGRDVIKVPKILKPPSESRIAVRGSSIALLTYLETDAADYSFQYKSVAQQHGLEFLSLPDKINLSKENLENYYDDVEVRLDYQRYASVNPVFSCNPIVYGITVPKNAPNPKIAQKFVDFVTGPEGREILLRENQPPLNPPVTVNPEKK